MRTWESDLFRPKSFKSGLTSPVLLVGIQRGGRPRGVAAFCSGDVATTGKLKNLNGAFMNIPEEIDRIKSAIKTVEDPGAATALRHVCKALAEISDQLEAEEGKKRRENEGIEVQ